MPPATGRSPLLPAAENLGASQAALGTDLAAAVELLLHEKPTRSQRSGTPRPGPCINRPPRAGGMSALGDTTPRKKPGHQLAARQGRPPYPALLNTLSYNRLARAGSPSSIDVPGPVLVRLVIARVPFERLPRERDRGGLQGAKGSVAGRMLWTSNCWPT